MPRSYTIAPLPERFWSKVIKSPDPAGCWLWLGARLRQGYGVITIAGKLRKSHRVAWELTYGPIPDDLLVCHHCDTPACVRPDHLFLGTNADNTADRDRKGRTARGDRSGSRLHPERLARGDRSGKRLHMDTAARGERINTAKLTAEAVREIRRLAAAGVATTPLARAFGMSNPQIRKIVARQSWRHIM